MEIDALQDAVVDFARTRRWEQFHDAKNLSMALAAEVGELNAVLRWVRSDHLERTLSEPPVQDALRAEIGDVGILLLSLCARTGIRLDDAIIAKLAQNESRYPADRSRGLAERPDDS